MPPSTTTPEVTVIDPIEEVEEEEPVEPVPPSTTTPEVTVIDPIEEVEEEEPVEPVPPSTTTPEVTVIDPIEEVEEEESVGPVPPNQEAVAEYRRLGNLEKECGWDNEEHRCLGDIDHTQKITDGYNAFFQCDVRFHPYLLCLGRTDAYFDNLYNAIFCPEGWYLRLADGMCYLDWYVLS